MNASPESLPDWTPQEVQQSCDSVLPPTAAAGIRFFNAGDYFMAHEELEIAWRAEPGPARDLYRAILQIGLGYYHILRGNYRGAVKMFQRCQIWLAPFSGVCRGVNVDRLREDYLRAEAELLRLGAERLAIFDRKFLKPIEWIDPEES
ncbi:MAG: DUF309 domain-containing protein [Anaerolineae bacterium]|nr:DUF309 domain-containing protein [Anaerolineae bacterium]